MVSLLYREPAWIVEGTTHRLIMPGLAAADQIIYLTHKNIFFQWFSSYQKIFSAQQ